MNGKLRFMRGFVFLLLALAVAVFAGSSLMDDHSRSGTSVGVFDMADSPSAVIVASAISATAEVSSANQGRAPSTAHAPRTTMNTGAAGNVGGTGTGGAGGIADSLVMSGDSVTTTARYAGLLQPVRYPPEWHS